MIWRASLLTIFPELFPGPLGASLSGKARGAGIWSCDALDIRDFAADKHRTVDDTPAGGGPGMVMKADVLARAIDAAAPAGDRRARLLLTPRGRPLTQARVRQLAAGPGVVVVCGRFEGVDQRIVEARALEEISIGDYVLSGGELAAMVLIDAVVRQVPGVLGDEDSAAQDSFVRGLLDCPHYTRPEEYAGERVPPVLVSGNHAEIDRWRLKQALGRTWLRRPDLLAQRALSAEEAKLLEEFKREQNT